MKPRASRRKERAWLVIIQTFPPDVPYSNLPSRRDSYESGVVGPGSVLVFPRSENNYRSVACDNSSVMSLQALATCCGPSLRIAAAAVIMRAAARIYLHVAESVRERERERGGRAARRK